MSKGKINPNAKTKLSNIVAKKPQDNNEQNFGFVAKNKHKNITKSFRINSFDLDKLNNLVREINNNTPYKNYSESEIIRGLISMGEKLPVKKIIKSLENSVF